jgi:DNA-binding GntR family transcriptional regulator
MNKTTDKCVTASRVYDQLRFEIIARKLKPSEFINVQEKADEFHTSSIPVREALLRLSERGLVDRQRNRGFMVHNYSLDEMYSASQLLYFILQLSSSNIKTECDQIRQAQPKFSKAISRLDCHTLHSQLTTGFKRMLYGQYALAWSINLDAVSFAWKLDNNGLVDAAVEHELYSTLSALTQDSQTQAANFMLDNFNRNFRQPHMIKIAL